MPLGPLSRALGMHHGNAEVQSLAGKIDRLPIHVEGLTEARTRHWVGMTQTPCPLTKTESITQGQIQHSDLSRLGSLALSAQCHPWGVIRPNRMTHTFSHVPSIKPSLHFSAFGRRSLRFSWTCASVISAQRPSHPSSGSDHFRVCRELPFWGLNKQGPLVAGGSTEQPLVSPRPHAVPDSQVAERGVWDPPSAPSRDWALIWSVILTPQGRWCKERSQSVEIGMKGGAEAAQHWGNAWALS